MEDPVWRFQPKADDNQTVQSLMKYTNSIVGSVWTSPGYLLIDTPWEERTGDLEFDHNRFQVRLFLFILLLFIVKAWKLEYSQKLCFFFLMHLIQ